MMSGVVTSNLVDWTLMQVSSFFLSISLTMVLVLLASCDTRPPYCTVVLWSAVVCSGMPSLVISITWHHHHYHYHHYHHYHYILTPETPGLFCSRLKTSFTSAVMFVTGDYITLDNDKQ